MSKERTMERIERSGIVPVATIDAVEKAAPLAKAMLAGDVDVIEVTFRTQAAPEAIRAIRQECPDMLAGAGTVLTLEQCRQAVDCGAQFIVSPGFDRAVVEWCLENGVAVVPGCVTPTELTAAAALGLKAVKFFPADICGGLKGMKTLSGPFPGIRFIPTSGINAGNAAEFLRAPFVFAVGGSWVCPKDDISAGHYDKITALCADTHRRILGFEMGHIGVNCDGAEESRAICMAFEHAFGFAYKPGEGSSDFSSDDIEVKKSGGRGTHGHIAILTNCLPCAVAEMRKRGVALDEDSWTYENGELIAVYLKDEIGGFAVHLLRKK